MNDRHQQSWHDLTRATQRKFEREILEWCVYVVLPTIGLIYLIGGNYEALMH